MRGAAILLLVPLFACGGRADEVRFQPKPHPLVDNLFVEQAAGNFTNMNLASGTFRIAGRCLTLHTGDAERTPIFLPPSGTLNLSAGSLVIGGGEPVRFGQLYRLPGAVAGPDLAPGAAASCPRQTVIVRTVEQLDSVPAPKMPPLTPRPPRARPPVK